MSIYHTETKPVHFCSVQLLRHVQFFVTPWTAAHKASLSITNSKSLLKLMSIESLMPSNCLTLCRPLLLRPLNIDLWTYDLLLLNSAAAACHLKANVREASVYIKEKLLYLGVQEPEKKVDSCSKANSSLPISA